MSKSVTFIHASDLHLGAPFKGLRALSSAWADKLVKAIPEAYQRIIDESLAQQVDFVIFSGDIFDNARPSYADFSLFIEGLKRLDEAHIPVYFCMGNHDPYTSWKHDFSALPANTYVFSPSKPDYTVFEKEGEPLVILGGRSYYTQAWSLQQDISQGLSRSEAFRETGVITPFVVGVIHTGLNIDPTRSPVEPKKLLKKKMDYWACGHIHQPMLMPKNHPQIVFAGCPQGRAIKEQGEHGIFRVTLSEGSEVQTEFIPTASVVWEQLYVDVSECSTIAEIQERITNEQFARNSVDHCQNMICRVTLTGSTPLHTELTPQVIHDLREVLNNSYPFFFIDSIVNHTRLVIDRSLLQKEGLFPAVLFDILDEQKKEANASMSYLEKQFYGRDLVLPGGFDRGLDELYEESETLLLDLLGNSDVS